MQSIKLGMLSALLSLTSIAGYAAAADATVAAADTTDTSGLEEVTVTAERYKSTIQDTPISISALTGDQLTAAGLTRIQDSGTVSWTPEWARLVASFPFDALGFTAPQRQLGSIAVKDLQTRAKIADADAAVR